MCPRTIWDESITLTLIGLWQQNLSAGQIARLLNITRDAVCGKIDRLKRGGMIFDHRAPPRPKKAKRERKPAKAKPKAPVVEPRKPIPQIAIECNGTTFDSQPCSILELDETRCRWPIGDPRDAAFCFCGATTEPGYIYCAHHTIIAYVPAEWRGRGKKHLVNQEEGNG